LNLPQVSPLVSVVIPTYNYARFLGQALRSVLSQTYVDWEVIVVDNHSEDNTDAVLNDWSDPRIRVLKIHNNGVIAASRNLGMSVAKGEWIAFLDADDCWYPRKLEKLLLAAAADPKLDVLCNDELQVDARTGSKKILRYGPYEKKFYKALLIEGNRLSPSATIVRREFLRRNAIAFNEDAAYATVEDYGFWLDLARFEARFKFIRQVQGEFVVHGANSSAQLSLHARNLEALLHDHVFSAKLLESFPERLWKLITARLRIDEVRRLMTSGQRGAGLRLAIQALAESPCSVATSFLLKLKKWLRR
jgi:glycosyltransferase involved in cell wall biosynthesis